MTDWPAEIKLETRYGHLGGPLFIYREAVRPIPFLAGQSLATYVLKSPNQISPAIEALAQKQYERLPVVAATGSWDKLPEFLKHGFRQQAAEDIELVNEQQ